MAKRLLAPRRQRTPRPRSAIQTVVDETIALYQWLAWVADRLYDEPARGTSRRWTLRRLQREGPSTVAALARIRTVRRQSLQPIVDTLVAEGFVKLQPNPKNARSPLVTLTPLGNALVASLDEVDAAVLRAVARGLDPGALETTALTLRALRQGFETKMRWAPAAAAAKAPSAKERA